MPKEPRNYREEYQSYHASEKQKKARAARNAARSEAEKEGKVHKNDNREVDHIKPLSKGGSNSAKNTRVVSRETNRRKYNKDK